MKSYSFIAISDIHLSNKLPFAKPSKNGRTDRLDDQLRLLEKVAKRARDVNGVYILGDLFDQSRVDAVTLTEGTRGLRKIADAAALHIMAGNHDAVNITTGGRFTSEVYGAIKHEGIRYLKHKREGFRPREWLRFWPVEFCSLEETRAKLAEARRTVTEPSDVTFECALLHQSIIGCGHEGWMCEEGHGLTPEEATNLFQLTIAGHFHTPQEFGENGFYCGSPLHFRFDDAKRDAGFWIVEVREDGTYTREFVDSGLPRFYVEANDGLKNQNAGRLAKYKSGDYVRIEVVATHADWTRMRPSVVERVELLRKDGVRADFKHKPLYQHTERLQNKSEQGKKIDVKNMVASYVKSSSVDVGGLDRKKLARIGLQALKAGKSEREAK